MPDPPLLALPGYPALAAHMGLTPELGIFRRFAAMGTKFLLYAQAELCLLEEELQKLEKQDYDRTKQDPTNKKDCTTDWYWLGHADAGSDMKQQWQLVLTAQEKLYKYRKFCRRSSERTESLTGIQIKL